MIVPLVIMQLGIAADYWGDLTLNAWSVHVHYWTGTAWYLFLIIQPYFVTHGQIARHRTVGIVGMFLAGGVCLTAIGMLHRDIISADRSLVEREQFGPFEPWFFLGVAAVEIVMMTAFGYAVIHEHHPPQGDREPLVVAHLDRFPDHDAGLGTGPAVCLYRDEFCFVAKC